jgi:predicted metal-dependent hydrolase
MQYRIIRSDRKTVALQVKAGEVIVRAPRAMTKEDISAFVNKHRDWIQKKLAVFPKETNGPQITEEGLRLLTKRAHEIIPPRVKYYASLIGVDYNRIAIRHQKTKWGSCSGKKNLNFNCLLLLTPTEVMDSVIVHELCHLKHMHHSKEFYNEVLRVCPDYKKHDRWLKQNGGGIIRRMPQK